MEKDAQLEAWVGRNPRWTYTVTTGGLHLVKDPLGRTVAYDRDPAAALATARRWQR